MNMNWFLPVRLFSGAGCLQEQRETVRSLGKRCLLMTGSASAQKSGALAEVMEVLESQNIDVTVYGGVLPDPPLSQCREAALAAQVCKAQFVVALGGGSVMDAAKAAALLANNSPYDAEAMFAGTTRHPALPLVAIGTTAGTGSEVTRAAVITRDETGRKQSFRNDSCYPRYVFADPRYTATMPRSVTVSTALDAVSHAVEGWFSEKANHMTRVCAAQALAALTEELWKLAEDPSALPSGTGRERLLYASLWAGMALNITGAAFPHTMGYVLTEDHGVPHGLACAAFLPSFLEHAEQADPAAAAALYETVGGRDRLFLLLARLAPVTATATEEQLAGYVARWEPTPANFHNTPGTFTAAEAELVLRKVLHQSR